MSSRESARGEMGAGFHCLWARPVFVGQCEFAEWTPDNHLRHSRFIALRADNDAKQVIKEDKVV